MKYSISDWKVADVQNETASSTLNHNESKFSFKFSIKIDYSWEF